MPKKVLMVCLGNICRSPLAEGILQSKISKELCLVDSAGTANYHVGEAPDYLSFYSCGKKTWCLYPQPKMSSITPS